MYRLDVYFFARQITDLPVYLILPVVFTLVIHLMVGFPWSGPEAASALSVLYGFSVLVAMSAGSYGYLLSAATPNMNVALIYGAAVLLPLMLFSGYTVRSSSLKYWNKWCQYLSWFWYADEAMMTHQLDYIKIEECGNVCTVKTVLRDEFDFRETHLMLDIFIILGIIIVLRSLSLLSLYIKSKQKK